MTFPIPNYSRIWVRGRFVDLAKAAQLLASYGLTGPVKFTPSPRVLLDVGTKQIISTSAFSVAPSATDGYFAIQLPATDDPDINPSGWTYAVTEPTGRSYNIVVPINTPVLDAPGDPLDGQRVLELITVVPAPAPNSGSVQLIMGASGRGIASMTVDGSSNVIVTYTDGTTASLGPVPGGVPQGALIRNVKDYGAVGNGTANDTAAIQAAFVGAKTVLFPPGTYRYVVAQGSSLVSLVGQRGVRVEGAGATLLDQSTHTTAGAFTCAFLLNNCHDVTISGLSYLGPVLTSPSTDLGYRGGIFVRAINASTDIKVSARLENARYGIQTGDYTTAATGYCRSFDLDLDCEYVGYPIAMYLADDVRATIRAEWVHRAAYLAGVHGADVDVRVQNNILGGTVGLLVTDSLTGTGTSRGCSNIKALVVDTGSTTYAAGASLAGVHPQRVDPGTVYSDIDIKIAMRGTNTICTNLVGFRVSSGATSAGYPFDWEQTIRLDNIKFSGMVDRSAQTTVVAPNSYAWHWDGLGSGSHYPLVYNCSIEDFTELGPANVTIDSWLEAPGLQDVFTFDRYVTPNRLVRTLTNTTSDVRFSNSKVSGFVTTGRVSTVNTEFATAVPSAPADLTVYRSPNVQTFTASGTWTKLPGARYVEIRAIGIGGAGGSGRRGAPGTIRCGGGAGGGGAVASVSVPASVLAAAETVTIGAIGAGGAAQTADDTNGNAGVAGGDCTFGTLLRAHGGFGGAGGTATTGTGGVATHGSGGVGAGASASTAGLAGPGAGVGNSLVAAQGGAAGGGITAANVASNGGTYNFRSSTYPYTGGAAGVVDGTAPGAGGNTTAGLAMPGTPAGGGASSVTTAAQAGGAGGRYGGGGAGGGASTNGNSSGAGGSSGPGIVVATTYF
jgi:hypothetical protein